MVAAGRLGRKTGRGYYDYPADGPYRPDDPEPLEPGGGDGRALAIVGDGPAGRRAARARARRPATSCARAARAELVVDAGDRRRSRSPPGGAPLRRPVRRDAAWPRAASRSASASTCCRRSTTRRWSS